nr:immunoglobulin heavy chain junction region [Macaca mulatta]
CARTYTGSYYLVYFEFW